MKRISLLVVLVFMMVPAPAKAQSSLGKCYCRYFVNEIYTKYPYYRQVVDYTLFTRGVRRGQRDEFRDGVYDWKKTHDFKSEFCKTHKKTCRAVFACLGAASVAIGKGLAEHQSPTQYATTASAACALAAAGVLVGAAG